jgi:hypothetical protein
MPTLLVRQRLSRVDQPHLVGPRDQAFSSEALTSRWYGIAPT